MESPSEELCGPRSVRGDRAVWACAGALIAVACGVRAAQYAYNKAIWLDEAYLALNILSRTYSGLLERLDYGQGAPVAFLMAERAAVDVFGPSEYALRAIPFAASVLSPFLLYGLLRRWVRWRGAMFALAVFAVSAPCIRYGGEVKPYATDVLTTLVLLTLMEPFARGNGGLGRGVASAIVGAVAVWCAYPAIFVLAGTVATLGIEGAYRRKRRAVAGWAAIGAVWAASFGAYYVVSLRAIGGNAEVRSWWSEAFMPFPPRSFVDVNWFVRAFFDYFADPVGLTAGGVGAVLFLVGLGPFLRRAPVLGAMLLTPLAFALLASGLQRYPFTLRFLLFSVPLTLPILGEGIERIRSQTRTPAILACVVAVALAQPAISAARSVIRPAAADGVRPVYAHLKEHARPADTVYYGHWAIFPMQYYEKKEGEIAGRKVLGESRRADWPYYVREIEALRGLARVWFVFETSNARLSGQERQFFTAYLDTVGRRIDTVESAESSAYLYDLQARERTE